MFEVILTAHPDSQIKTKILVVCQGGRIPCTYKSYIQQQNLSISEGAPISFWVEDQKIVLASMSKEASDLDWEELGKKIYTEIANSAEVVLEAKEDDKALLTLYGILQASYHFYKYKTTQKAEDFPALEKITIKVANVKKAEAIYRDYVASYTGIRYARDLCNEPANYLTPEIFAQDINRLKYLGFEISVLDKKELALQGLKLIEAVGQGSANEPKMVIVSWRGNRNSKTYDLGLIGKGVCFDAGGLSLKTTQGMLEMKQDMSGAAAVIAAMKTTALRCIKKNILAILPLVENMPDGNAIKIGDVYTSYCGKTVEVDNADAEGRLIVADALSYMQKNYKVKTIIDVTTLGSLNGVLGKVYAGVFANDEKLVADLLQSGDKTGEKLWRMPLHDQYGKALKSTIADIKNVAPEAKASITSAAFLESFIEKGTVWAHIDMSNMRMDNHGLAAGFGVKLLNEFIRKL